MKKDHKDVDPNDTAQGVVEKLVYRGKGLVRLLEDPSAGEIGFVPLVVPGELVSIRKTKNTKPFQGKVVTWLKRNREHRVTPRCDHFGLCGGCTWQYLNINQQRRWKSEIVMESLMRIGKLPEPNVLPIDSDGASYGYRNSTSWMLSKDQTFLGFHPSKSSRVIPIDRCHLVTENASRMKSIMESVLSIFRGRAEWKKAAARGALFQQVIIRTNEIDEVLVSLVKKSKTNRNIKPEVLQEYARECTAAAAQSGIPLAGIEYTGQALSGNPFLLQSIGDIAYRVSGQSFFQVNNVVIHKLIDYMKHLLPDRIACLWDLYSGVGTFSFALADKIMRGIMAEASPSALDDCSYVLQENKELSVKFSLHAGDVSRLLGGGAAQSGGQRNISLSAPDVVIIDPPRAGCSSKVLARVAADTKNTIIYVSCDPTTMARDIKNIINLDSSWKLLEVKPFDMFPQTYHVEAVAFLQRVD